MVRLIFLILISSVVSAFIPNSFTTEYEQKAKKKIGKGFRVATGIFEYKYPGNLRVTQVAPDELVYVSNPKKTWIYRAPFDEDEKAEVMIHKGQESSLSSFFDILKSGLKSNGNYKVQRNKKGTFLTFTRSARKKTGVAKASLSLGKMRDFKNLTKIRITYEDGREIVLKLNKTKVNVKFKKKHFVFKVPKGANVTYQ